MADSSFSFGTNSTIVNPNITLVSSSSYSIPGAGEYVFTGTSATWSLPGGVTNLTVTIKNRGTGVLSVTGTIFKNTAVSSVEFNPGDAVVLTFDGTYYNVK
jgi:hypothetical protein